METIFKEKVRQIVGKFGLLSYIANKISQLFSNSTVKNLLVVMTFMTLGITLGFEENERFFGKKIL